MTQRNRRQRGAAMVEAAIAVTVLTFLTFAIIQFGMTVNAIVTVQYYAKEAARYAAVHYTDATFSPTKTVQDYVKNNLATSANTIPYSSLTSVTYYAPGATLDSGTKPASSTLTVEIKYNMANRVYFSPWISPPSWNYTSYSTTFAEGQ